MAATDAGGGSGGARRRHAPAHPATEAARAPPRRQLGGGHGLSPRLARAAMRNARGYSGRAFGLGLTHTIRLRQRLTLRSARIT
jgi:hypothetical protein